MWEKGKVVVDGIIYPWEAKIYDEGSKYGIDGGRVSKLYVWRESEDDEEMIIVYDRGWTTPRPDEGSKLEEILNTVLAGIDIQMKNKEK